MTPDTLAVVDAWMAAVAAYRADPSPARWREVEDHRRRAAAAAHEACRRRRELEHSEYLDALAALHIGPGATTRDIHRGTH